MYNVSDAYLEAIKRPVIKYSITGTIGSNNFNAYTLKEGSFQITNQCTDTNKLMLGSCNIGQLKALFCNVSIIRNEWLDKVITPSCSVEVSEGQYESVPLGVFTIKQAEQTAEGVQVTAYDNMFKFDKLFDATDKDFDKTGKPYYFLNKICQKCGVTLGMTQNEVNALPNGDNTMYICGVRKGTTDYANDIETYRDALFYLAQACACFATINRLGRLELRPFRQSVTDYISDTDRLAGAEFADYVTSFTGIYVDSLYDGRTTYYGYDLEKLQENLAEYTERKEEEEDVVDEDEADIAEIQEKYDQGQITEEEYAEQMAAATKKLKEDEAKLKATNKYLNWLNKAIAKAQANAQGTNMDLEGNPFLQHRDSSIRSIAKVTTATELRTTIMRRLSKMEYVPFSCSSVFGIHYDLGDRIMFTDGHADDDLGCITAFDWTYNGEYSMYGYGANPDEATVRPKIEKAMKQANENALNRADIGMVEVDDNVPEGSPKPVVVRKRSAASSTGENWVSKVIYIWSYYKYSAGSVPQCGITRVKVSCTTGFALCTYDPGRDVYPGENENIINGIKRHDLMITFVALQIPVDELDSYELPKIKFECTRVYAPDSEHALDVTPQTFSVPEGQDTMEMIGYKTVQDPDDVYLYWRLPIASIQYGAVAHGIATEYSQDSVNFHFNSMNAWTAAGVIFLDTIPDLKPGDVMLPTATSQKETAASVENIARKIAGAGSDESQYVDASFLDEGYVNGAVDVESKTLHEAIGKSIDKVFENLDPNIREIYYNTVEPGSIDYYIKDYFHGGDANRLFEYKTYDGVEHHLTIGSGIPTLFADEYLLDEIINDSHYNLESPFARGKVYIRIGDKSGIRLVGEAGEDCSAADNPKFTMGGWGNAMRRLNNGGYALWASRNSEDDMTQYIEYSLANTEGGKTYSMSFDFHASIITGECGIDTTRPLGILISTSSSLDSSILDDLPLDENVWHDSDPDNMYLSFYNNFQIVTISPQGEMTLEYQHYSFTFTAQAGKDYYIYFITSSFVSEDATNRLRMRVKDFVSSEGVGVAEIKVSYQGGPSFATDEWYTIEGGSGGGGTSDLDAIEITYADYQLLTPEEKADPDKIYFITDYPTSGGSLEELSDVDIDDETLSDGQVLTYDETADKWVNGNAPTPPTVGNGTITIQKNGTSVDSFTTNQSSNKTINITMSKSDVGLGNVDNTSDANKPISNATAVAIAGSKTATGSVVTVTDAAPIYAEQVDVAVVATQSGSGTPSPSNIRPIQGYDIVSVDRCGKNLVNPNEIIVGYWDSTTYYSDDRFKTSGLIRVKPNTTYISSIFNKTTKQRAYSLVYTEWDKDGNIIGQQVTSETITTSQNTKYIRVRNFGANSDLITGNNFLYQLEEGTTATTYEPYNGQTVSLQLGNKNLLPMTVEGIKAVNTSGTWSGNVYSINNGTITVLTDANGLVTSLKANGTFNATTILYTSDVITSQNNKPLKLSGCPTGGTTESATTKTYCLRAYDSSSSAIANNVTNNDTDVTPTNGIRVAIIIWSGYSASNKIFYPMLRSATVTDPTFSPYNPTLGGMVYGGQLTLNDDGSAVFVGDRVCLNGGWEYYNASNGYTAYRILNVPARSKSISSTSDLMSDCISEFGMFSSSAMNKNIIEPPYSNHSTTAYLALKDDLSAANVQLSYEIDTPFTIHLSAEQLKLLQGTNNVWSNAGDVTLKYQPDNVIGEAIGVSEDYTDKMILLNTGYLRSVYLGDSYTQELKEDIQSGMFQKARVGGFLQINNHIYDFVHADYFLNTGHPGDTGICKEHHMVVVPRDCLVNGKMNSTDITTTGYSNSDFRKGTNSNTALQSIKDIITADFGANNILTHDELLVSAAVDGYEKNTGWYVSTVDLMNEIMALGARVWGGPNKSNAGSYSQITKAQFKLFAERPDLLTNGTAYFLRDVATTTNFSVISNTGICYSSYAGTARGIRPYFLIH